MGRPKKLPPNVRRCHGKFRAVAMIDGRRVYGPLRLAVEDAAKDAAKMLKVQKTPFSEVWTIGMGLLAVQEDLRAQGRRPATLKYYQNYERILLRAWHPDTPLACIKAVDLRQYIEVRLADGLSYESIWGKELQVLARVFNLGLRLGKVEETPFEDIKKPTLRQKRFTWLPAADTAQLLERIRAWPGSTRCRERDIDVITIAMLTGCRRAELARLRPADVDFAARRLHVEGKTGNRYVPLANQAIDALRRCLARCGTGPLLGTEKAIEKLFENWQRRLNEPRLAPRALRHGYATELAGEHGLCAFEVRELMGHASVSQTMRYFHAREEKLREGINRLGTKLTTRAPEAT